MDDSTRSHGSTLANGSAVNGGERQSSTGLLSMIGSALPFRVDNKLSPSSTPGGGSISGDRGSASLRQGRSKAVDTLGAGSYSLEDHDRTNASLADSDSPDTYDAESPKDKSMATLLPDVKMASSRRNAEFHKLFPKVPASEALIDDWSCALAREILVQGRLYATPRFVCFHSNILGWTSNLIIPFKEIMGIQPKTTAGIFPNGIMIQRLHTRHNFATFVNRDAVLKLLDRVWHSRFNAAGSSGDSSNMWDSDSDASHEDSSDASDSDARSRKRASSGQRSPGDSGSGAAAGAAGGGAGGWPVPNLGPDTHAPTSIPSPDAKEKVIDNSTIHAPLGVVCNLIYGDDTAWYLKFTTEVEGNKELPKIPAFKEGDGGISTRAFEYVRPLSGPVGPKQTRCITTETREEWNMEDKAVVLTTTRTPDVPSGDAFTIFTRTVLAWGPNNSTVMQTSTWVEWTGKSWIKGPVEKGAVEGQTQHCKTLAEHLEQAVGKRGGGGGGGSGTRKRSKPSAKKPKEEEPARPQSPVARVLGALQSAPARDLLLILLVLVVGWLVFSSIRHYRARPSADVKFLEQELKLWRWLDDRTLGTEIAEVDYGEMSQREVQEVIRLTERKLAKLREIAGGDK